MESKQLKLKNLYQKLLANFAIIFSIIFINYTKITIAVIPEYKGLYTLFENQDKQLREKAREMEIERSLTEDNIICIQEDSKTPEKIDPISYGQAMLYSGVIENIYTYCHEDNAARKVIATLWHKHLIDQEGNFNNEARFGLSNHFPVTQFIPEDIGKIIKYIRDFSIINDNGTKKTYEQLKSSRNTFIKTLSKRRLRSGNCDEKLYLFLENLENLKCDQSFYEETAEAILWAFFEAKFYGQETFLQCLDQISPDLKNNLNELYDFESVKEEFYANNNKLLEETICKIIQNNSEVQKYKDMLLYLAIKVRKSLDTPPTIGWMHLVHTDKETGKKLLNPLCPGIPVESETCFESALLEFISILLYNKETKLFDPASVLPSEITHNNNFLKLIRNIFCSETKSAKSNINSITENEINPEELICPEKINLRTEKFARMLTNLDDIDYTKQLTLSHGKIFKYDLTGRFENFVKLLNKFFGLGLEFIDTSDNFTVKDIKNSILNSEIKINRNREAPSSITKGTENETKCKEILDLIFKKLSTEQRPIIIDKIKNCKVDINIYLKIGKTKIIIVLAGRHGEIKVEKNYGSNLNFIPTRFYNKIAEKKQQYQENLIKNTLPLILFSIDRYNNPDNINKDEYNSPNNIKILNLTLPCIRILAPETDPMNQEKDILESENILGYIYKLSKIENPRSIRLITENDNLKNIISNIAFKTKPDQQALFRALIAIKSGNLINEPFLGNETYNYIKKIIEDISKNGLPKSEENYILNNFDKILLFADNFDKQNLNGIDQNNYLQNQVLLLLKKALLLLKKEDYNFYFFPSESIISFYRKNLKSEMKNQFLYKKELEKIISSYINEVIKHKKYYCNFTAKNLAETESTNFENDFLKEKFLEIIKNPKIDLKAILEKTVYTKNEEAIKMLPVEKLLHKNSTPLAVANTENIIKLLLACKNVTVNPQKPSPLTLLLAKIFGNIPAHGCFFTPLKEFQKSPLIETIKYYNLNKFKLLMARKEIDVNASETILDYDHNPKNNTFPLIEAIGKIGNENGREMLTLLLENKDIDVNNQNSDGLSALHSLLSEYCNRIQNDASTSFIIEITKKLLSRPDIKLDLKYIGFTPVEFAKHLSNYNSKKDSKEEVDKKITKKIQAIIDLLEESEDLRKIRDAQEVYF